MRNGRKRPLGARGVAARAAVAGALSVPGAWAAADLGSVPVMAHPGIPAAAPAKAPAAHQATSEQPPVGPQGSAAPTAPPVNTAHSAAAGGSVVAAAPTADGRGFWMAWSNGGVTTAGDATWLGDMSGAALNGPIVGISPTTTGHGYWLLGKDGGVFSFGDAGFFGSTGNVHLNAPALQMASTRDARGYDFVAGDGGIFTFGDAGFFGSTGGMWLNQPVVGMSTTPSGNGYWLVARDGGIFTFGDAGFYGSTGGSWLNQPVVGMSRTGDGRGYWLVARDGGIFTFGDAPFLGSAVGMNGGSPVVGMVTTGDGGGYWVVTASGQIDAFGDAAPTAGPVAASAPSDGNFAFEVVNAAGVPARWNPCEAVHYSVVPLGAPAGWQNDVANDISQAAQATGLSFVNDGTYSSAPSVPSSSKMVISWVSALSGGDDVGLTTYQYYNTSGYSPQIVSAQIQLLNRLGSGGGLYGEQPVLLHEVGHALGLAHVNAGEVMNPVDQGYGNYQGGDLNGLQRLGSSLGCAGFYG